MARSLKQRLDRCMKHGALSLSDVATWTDLSYQTLRGYLEGVTPREPRASQIDERLRWLESAVQGDARLPIPITVRQGDRAQYILKIRADYAR